MLREIIIPTSDNYNIHIPEEYINKEIEILVLPFSNNKKSENILPEEDIKTLLASVSEGLEDQDLRRQTDLGREVSDWLT